ncbi:MAG: phosphoribosylanthranilate isomerase [Bacteroidetes bacterium]|nr:phosphoribosylanthranilate isomerase [Bacteroidota bacterium]
MKIKICGIKYQRDLESIIPLQPDYLGFIFYPKSARCMRQTLSTDDVKLVPKSIKKVGVFVNEDITELLKMIKSYQLDGIQLHGDESPEYLSELQNILKDVHLKVEVIKAFGIDPAFDLQKLNDYKQYCNYFLFDTKTPKYGGSGLQFDWNLISDYDNELSLWMSGGMDVEDVKKLMSVVHLNMAVIDMNSKLETEPGVKDIVKVKKAIDEVRNQSK